MKQLFSGNPQANWGNKIIKDLAFIKRKGRYPITYKVISPICSALVLFTFTWPVLLNGIAASGDAPRFALFIMLACSAMMLGIAAYQLVTVFSFKRIETTLYLQGNKDLLIKFLLSQHLAYTQHPDAQEVFMIISKNLSVSGDFREVMVFIADDKQILINSHFSGSRISINPPSKYYKQMANRLKEWIKTHANTASTQALSFSKN
ncbi:hypothetical protein CAP35_10680 [Chitinophagaceae bacterium IBVUCB1]|nr:hypothetical protein CAP35_10680 [Chitinophagaceae bacterium IBVUCB1]